MTATDGNSFWHLSADAALELLLDNLFSDKTLPVFNSEKFRQFVLNPSGAATKFRTIKSRTYNYMQQHRLSNISKLRKYGIPHPKAYADICLCIHENWAEIQNLMTSRWGSHTINLFLLPKSVNMEDIYEMWFEYEKDPEKMKDIDVNDDLLESVRLAFGKKYCTKADIANFYPSVYTHSIAWSAVGRDTAFKQRFDKTKWYNKLDVLVRKSQNEESIGLHVGPYTSNIISDIVLSSVDDELIKHGFVFNRVIDDYKCFTESADECMEFVMALSSFLHKIKLDINSNKTRLRTR